jgi:beta-galactosidase/beta-glucuronidase
VRFTAYDAAGQMRGRAEANGESGEIMMAVDEPELWSPNAPVLYTLKCEHESGDTEIIHFGIRTFAFDPDNGFFLNGVNMKLKGVCIHHDAGALGAAVHKNVWARRFAKLREAGVNAIRFSHNPPDPQVLDLCDAMGFLAIDEAFDEWEGCKNKWWQGHNVYPPKRFGYSDAFPMWHEADLTAMVKRDRNHPSIILWSIGNEIDYPNDPYAHPLFDSMTGNNDANKPEAERIYDPNRPNAERLVTVSGRLSAIVKRHDCTRPVTAALAFPELSNKTGFADTLEVVGYNYKEQLYEADHIMTEGWLRSRFTIAVRSASCHMGNASE